MSTSLPPDLMSPEQRNDRASVLYWVVKRVRPLQKELEGLSSYSDAT